jgi:hypothetical protein
MWLDLPVLGTNHQDLIVQLRNLAVLLPLHLVAIDELPIGRPGGLRPPLAGA